jgi:predicted outer membrane repeat protein
MTLRSWIRNLFARPATRLLRKAPYRGRLIVEVLEDRTVPSTFYVNASAAGAGNGSSWANAYTTLQAALAAAASAGGGLICVAQGVYATNSSFNLPANVEVIGGFNGTGTARDPVNYVTKLVGVAGSPVVVNNNAGGPLGEVLDGFTIADGQANNGGGIFNSSTLTVVKCTLVHNSATQNGGGIYNGGTLTVAANTLSGNTATQNGGGIYNSGTLTVPIHNYIEFSSPFGDTFVDPLQGIGSALTNNVATNGSGGGIYSNNQSVVVPDTTLIGNTALNGGGIFSSGGTLTVDSSILTNNVATNGSGGGIASFSDNQVSVSNSSFTANTASNGGAIASVGNVFLSVSNNKFVNNAAAVNGGAIDSQNDGAVQVANSNFTGNTAGLSGGAIAGSSDIQMVVNNSAFAGNNATQNGGGIFSSGTLTVANSTLSGNSATQNGGGVYTIPGGTGTLTFCTVSGNSALNGGGLFMQSAVALTNCTISSNHATVLGGGLFSSQGTATVTDCTLASNVAGLSGGAIEAQGSVTVTGSTLSANQASPNGQGGGGGAIDEFVGLYTVTVGNSILAGNSCAYGPDFSNGVVSLGHNLVGKTDGSSGWIASDRTGTIAAPLNPLLAPLGNYGGPTQTMALLPGSPAINAGDNLLIPAGVTTDQRGPGYPRIRGGTVDIGAFESSAGPTITTFTVPATGAEGSPVNLSAGVNNDPNASGLTYTWTITAPPGAGPNLPLTGASVSFTPPDEGNYSVGLTVTAADGSATSLPAAGLVSWWRGDGNANDAVGGNNGTLVGGVTYAAGKVGQAFSFNGTNQVQVPSAANLNLTSAVTVEAWIKPSTLAFNGGFGAVIAKSSGGARNYGLFVTSTGALHLSYFTTGGANVILQTAANLVPAGQFSHVAATIDPSGGVMQIYVNGQLVASRATAGPFVANTAPLTIGLSDNFGFQGLIDEPAVYNRALNQIEIQSIVNAGSAGKSPLIAVANVPPTAALATSYTTYLSTEIATFTLSATDPSTTDVAGFTYNVNWGDGSPVQTIAATAGNGSGVQVTHVFVNANTYTVSLTATDEDGGVSTAVTKTITALAVTSTNLQTIITAQGSIATQDTNNTQAQTMVTAVNGLAAQTKPVTITMQLGSGSFTDTSGAPHAGITLVISGSGGTTKIVGQSPALQVSGGNVIVTDLTLVTATSSPTLVVSNGNLTLRNVVIQGTASGSQPAVQITGGTVDLGSAADPGGNTFNANGPGELIHNAGSNGVSAVGDTFQVGATTLTSPYRIKDKIFDALNAGGGGLVTYVPGNAYISVNGGDIQRGVDAIAAGGTVNVEAGGLYQQYEAGSKLLTVKFQNGPTLSQQPNPQNASLRDLVVTGNDGNDHIHFTPGGQAIQAQVDGFPNGRFNPSGRLVAYGVAGNNTIQVAGSITLPAWLYAGPGNDLMQGGGGNDVLVGGAGNDTLIAGSGRDLLIGGSGAAQLVGNSGDDILIAGTTAFDTNQAALAALMAEWTSARSYADRVANLSGTGSGPRNNGSVFLIASGPGATVFATTAVDQLLGGSGMNWYFAKQSGTVKDLLTGLHDGEIVEALG